MEPESVRHGKRKNKDRYKNIFRNPEVVLAKHLIVFCFVLFCFALFCPVFFFFFFF